MTKRTKSSSKWSAFARPDGTFDFDSLSDSQKEEFYIECEAMESTLGEALTPAQRQLHTRARRRGRPRQGKGAEIVSLSIEKELLRRAERLAKDKGLSRSELFSRGLRALLAASANRRRKVA